MGFHWSLALLLLLAMAVIPVTARAQGLFGDGDAQRREAEMALRNNQLEGQIRNLNGQIEQMGFQLRQMQDQMLKMQKDMDFRLQELENTPQGRRPPKKTELTPPASDTNAGIAPGAGPSRSPPGVPAPGLAAVAPGTQNDQEEADDARPSAGMAPDGTAAPIIYGQSGPIPPAPIGQGVPMPSGPRQGPGAPPQVLGQIPRSQDPLGGASDGPVDLSQGQRQVAPARPSSTSVSPVPGVTPKYATAQPTPNARDEYDAAYGYIMSGEYVLAERSFKTFLANHPTDRRAGGAQFWLGESYFQRNMHREATDAFLKSYTQYPDDTKAPDSLLKLGLAYQGLGERKAACNAYEELLAKYPKASKALRDRAQAEKSRGKCA